VVNGSIKKGQRVKFMSTGKQYDADEIGVNLIKQTQPRKLKLEMLVISFPELRKPKRLKLAIPSLAL
jgi:translation elongation factor EF-4